MLRLFFIVLCCLTSVRPESLDFIEQRYEINYQLSSKYWAWNNEQKNEADTEDLNQQKNVTDTEDLNQQKNETDAQDLNQQKNETDTQDLNQQKNETDTQDLNQQKNETNTLNLNEQKNETDTLNLNAQKNETDTLNLNEQKNETDTLNLNEQENETDTLDLSEQQIARYITPNTCQCSSVSIFKSFKIIGGFTVTNDVSFPYQALFYIAGFSCGATVINKRYLLSAMHCIFDQDGQAMDPADALILVGTSKFSVAGGTVLKATEFIQHPDFVKSTMQNDILLIKVKDDIPFSSRVRPACLPTSKTEKYVGREARVTGWGATVGYERIPPTDLEYADTLKHTAVKVLDSMDRRCVRDTLSDKVTKLCAYTTGTDACQGDSGGPLTVLEGGVHTLIGVVSYGFGCAAKNHPGIYTRITNYLDWIVDNTKDGRC